MELSTNAVFLVAICFLGALSVAILCYYSLVRKFYALPLIFYLGFITLWIFHRFLIETKFIMEVPHLFRFSTPISVLLGPSIYLYVRSLVKNEVQWQKRNWLLFSPAIVVMLSILPFYLRSAAYKRTWLENLYAEPKRFGYFLESVLPPYVQHIFDGTIVVVFGILAISSVIKYWKQPSENKRTIQKTTIRWAFFHSTVIVLLGITGMSVSIFEILPQIYFYSVMNSITAITVLPLFVLIFFNPSILYGNPNSQIIEYSDNTSNEGKRNSYGLSADNIDEIIVQIDHVMKTNKPFLRKDFSSEQLANMIGVSRHQISYVINNALDSNFQAFVNDLRIRHCLENIDNKDWKTLTIDGIADRAGYRNRGTFTRAFKNVTGMLPSDYRKSQGL